MINDDARSEAIEMAISALQAQDVPDTNVGDMISRQAAIGEIRKCRFVVDAIEKIRGLPSVQPEQTNCDYCHEDSDGYVKPIEKNCHAFIRFGMNGWEISLSAKGWNGSAKIMYCPMCESELNHGRTNQQAGGD